MRISNIILPVILVVALQSCEPSNNDNASLEQIYHRVNSSTASLVVHNDEIYRHFDNLVLDSVEYARAWQVKANIVKERCARVDSSIQQMQVQFIRTLENLSETEPVDLHSIAWLNNGTNVRLSYSYFIEEKRGEMIKTELLNLKHLLLEMIMPGDITQKELINERLELYSSGDIGEATSNYWELDNFDGLTGKEAILNLIFIQNMIRTVENMVINYLMKVKLSNLIKESSMHNTPGYLTHP